jgi:hypothetical protein
VTVGTSFHGTKDGGARMSSGDAVVECPKCEGDRVTVTESGVPKLCDRCDGEGRVASRAFRIPLRRAQPGTRAAIERRYARRADGSL